MRLSPGIATAHRARRDYFNAARVEIARENLLTMQTVGAIGALISCFFFFITPFFIPNWSFTAEYYLILPLLAAVLLFSLVYERRVKKTNPLVVELVCMAVYVLILASCTAISIFPFPGNPQIFISLCFMLMPALFIVQPFVLGGVMLAAELVYLLLAARYKTDYAFSLDAFNTVAALLLSCMVMAITNRLRVSSHRSRSTLEKLSQTDALTGLMNKSTFEHRCDLCLRSSSPDSYFALIMLDLDNFKEINDTYGHPVGDKLLEEVGRVLRSNFRQSDFVGRVGGDEFAVFLRSFDDLPSLEHSAQNLSSRLSAITLGGESINVTCSVGISYFNGSDTSYQTMFRSADVSLYRAKRARKSFAKP